jgi:hypothetical protein
VAQSSPDLRRACCPLSVRRKRQPTAALQRPGQRLATGVGTPGRATVGHELPRRGAGRNTTLAGDGGTHRVLARVVGASASGPSARPSRGIADGRLAQAGGPITPGRFLYAACSGPADTAVRGPLDHSPADPRTGTDPLVADKAYCARKHRMLRRRGIEGDMGRCPWLRAEEGRGDRTPASGPTAPLRRQINPDPTLNLTRPGLGVN